MKPIAIAGVLLIVLGLTALVYPGVSYTSRDTVIDISPITATADRQKTLPIPPVLGILPWLAAWRCWSSVHASATEVVLTN